MPIYEFYCPDNNKVYQFFARTLEQGKKVPQCPDNPAFRMERMISGFAIGAPAAQSAKGGDEGGGPGGMGDEGGEGPAMDDARMEQAMKVMEREFSALDTDNPDPRALGQMMRKMSDLTGEKFDESTEEVVRKLEEGADPESLEEQMDGLMGEEGGPGGGMGMGGGGFGGRPTRDPQLYDYD
jgi:hypothetical protein